MDRVEQLGKGVAVFVADTARKAAEKAGNIAKIVELKNRIATCEAVKKKNYMEIGKLYYEQFKDCEEELFAKQCKAIYNAENAIAELQAQIEEIVEEVK